MQPPNGLEPAINLAGRCKRYAGSAASEKAATRRC
jgi:hypothetical protein